MTTKALESWARADLVAEVKRLRDENAALKSQVSQRDATALTTAAAPNRPQRTGTSGKRASDHDRKHVAFDDCVGVRGTADALLVRFDDGSEDWVPRSQIGADSEVANEDDAGVFVMTRWLADQRGWL